MTPKEKAKELIEIYVDINEFYNLQNNNIVVINYNFGKQCALIAVDLRLEGDFIFTSIEYGIDSFEYWQEVKQEIELL